MALTVSRKFAAPANTETVPKTGICLHYTAGSSVAGAVAHWQTLYAQSRNTTPIGTPYLIDRTGTIFQVFDPATQWAWHLGIGEKAQDSRLIGIELVNWGPLQQRGNGIYSPVGYTTAVLASEVHEAKWRGFEYWQTFPEGQMQALRELLADLSSRFDIPLTLPPAEWRTPETIWPEAKTWRGVVSHQHYRKDKFDAGPAFDWSRLGA